MLQSVSLVSTLCLSHLHIARAASNPCKQTCFSMCLLVYTCIPLLHLPPFKDATCNNTSIIGLSALVCSGEGQAEGGPTAQGQPSWGHSSGVLQQWQQECFCFGFCTCQSRKHSRAAVPRYKCECSRDQRSQPGFDHMGALDKYAHFILPCTLHPPMHTLSEDLSHQ